ncbi:MAG: DeoR/GlpR family DNA-binding transcription regulator [Lentisphaeria bacterium]|nr:DeoR/GlpR family DNA-binding transcription regulator [Lentisphaeria bacterium]
MLEKTQARYKEILNYLELHGPSKVKALAQHCRVTEETIRRDLSALEESGKLFRRHGGAVLQNSLKGELDFEERKIQNISEKTIIAREALKILNEGDTIFLDGSTTAWQMAQSMPDMNVTVITDSIRVLQTLATHKTSQVIILGGRVWAPSQSLIGPQTLASINQYHVDKFFFSCKGLDTDWGLSDNNPDTTAVTEKMLQNSNQNILLIDHAKFNKKALIRFAEIDQVSILITDLQTNKKTLQDLESMGLEIIIAEPS